MGSPRISWATEHEVPEIRRFITELARYERLEHEMVATDEGLRRTLFGPRPGAEVLFAWEGQGDGATRVAFALFFQSYSTFLGLPGIYLEDLFVLPEHRGKGHGKALLSFLARLALERGCGRLEWSVLDWNEPAIGFYRSIGATALDGWTVNRLTGPGLARVAAASVTSAG